MKKFKKIIYTCLLPGLLISGCNSFLDVNPSGEVTQDKMFEDVQGYRDAMYGVYSSIAKTSLYGKNLSYGFADQLAQLFYSPAAEFAEDQTAVKTLEYDYTHPSVEALINSIWSDAYQVISYINNILENIRNVDVNQHIDYRLIKGEAYALRGFLHFDLMRYFCDNIQTNPGAGGIPYAYTFDLKNKEVFTLKECYSNVLQDLSEAQQLLANDTAVVNNSGYRDQRYNFVNLYAVYAMKARVFYAENLLDSAGYYAAKVIASNHYHLITLPTDLINAQKYPGSSELIWGLYNIKLYDPFYSEFLADPSTNFNLMRPRPDIKTIYQDASWNEQNHDYRWDNFFGTDSKSQTFIRLLKVNDKDPGDVQKQKEATKGICVLRLPEMYYIAAEALYAKGEKTLASDCFNAVRASRGLNQSLEDNRVNTFEKFQAELLKERRKEFWGEGQTFLDYKRTNTAFMDVTSKKEISPVPAISILPWPRNEQEYGATHK